MQRTYDALVCGGGPGGIAAALWLGRYRRRVLVVDAGEQRNLAAHRSHGYLTRDGCEPGEFLSQARAELRRYDTVTQHDGLVETITGENGAFEAVVGDVRLSTKRVVLATGVRDAFPDVPGFRELYGTSIFHCSCCDGYEALDEDVLAIGWGEHVSGFALDLLEWGARVVLITDGRAFEGDDACSVALRRNDVEVVEEEVTEIRRDGERMLGAITSSGRFLAATKAFFSIAHEPRSDLARELGCRIDDLGYVKVDDKGRTSVEGVYAVGDVTPGEQMVQVAAGAGLIAGIACAQSLRGERPVPGAPPPGPDPSEELEDAARIVPR